MGNICIIYITFVFVTRWLVMYFKLCLSCTFSNFLKTSQVQIFSLGEIMHIVI